MKRILIADDELGIVELVKTYFEMTGYQVITAPDGRRAIEKASEKPDLILLDVNMPDLDGFEVCRRIREYVSCPIIFLTARTESSDKILGLRTGADRESFDAFLEEICRQVPGSYYISYEKAQQQMEESFAQTRMLAWGLILLIGFIGVQRAIGMSVRSLYKTFLWEAFYYALAAVICGSVVGYVCTVFVQAAKTDSLSLALVPVIPMAQAAIFAAAACFGATGIPLIRIGRMEIVKALGEVE